MITIAKDAKPKVSYQTISIRQTIADISGITRNGVYDAQTHSFVYIVVYAALRIEIMQIKLVHTVSKSRTRRTLSPIVRICT